MSNAIIVHGKPRKDVYFNHDLPSASNSIWIPWLQRELLLLDIPTQTPEMIHAWQPDYKIWSEEFERYKITPDTLLIGHSLGAGFLVQWLSEHTTAQVGHIFLIAPSLGDRFTPNSKYKHPTINGFFEFEIDPYLLERTQSITIFHSDIDNERIASSVRYIRAALPSVEYREFHNDDHFSLDQDGNMRTEFPELLEVITAKLF